MTPGGEPRHLSDLTRWLATLGKSYEELHALACAKIQAMRRADISALRDLQTQEAAAARRLQGWLRTRRKHMRALAADLAVPAEAADDITVSQLASHLTTEPRSRLLSQADRLREVAGRLARTNRVAGAVSREILHHLTWVFASVRPKAESASDGLDYGVTSRRGVHATGRATLGILEAIG